MTIHFDCTMCGRCCHNLRLPLSVDEAVAWAARGGLVEALSDATPWLTEPDATDAAALYQRERSFAATSGDVPVRVATVLVGAFEGPCPNLQPDMRCGIYEERPRVCRIYPAEVNPFMRLDPAAKACPPEAWDDTQPIYVRDDRLVDADTKALIADSRAAAMADVAAKRALFTTATDKTAALANEGFATSTPSLAALLHARENAAPEPMAIPVTIVSNRAATLATLSEAGATGTRISKNFIAFFPDD